MALIFHGRSAMTAQESGLSAQAERANVLGVDDDCNFVELVSGKSKDKRPKRAERLRLIQRGYPTYCDQSQSTVRSEPDFRAIARQLDKKG